MPTPTCRHCAPTMVRILTAAALLATLACVAADGGAAAAEAKQPSGKAVREFGSRCPRPTGGYPPLPAVPRGKSGVNC